MKILFLVVSVLMIVSSAQAEGVQKNRIVPVFGKTKYSSSIGQVSDRCYMNSSKSLPEGTGIVITGINTCKLSYSGEDEKFFKIALKGQAFSIKADNVEVEEDNLKRLESLTETDAELYREEALNATKALWRQTVNKALAQLDKTKKFGITILNSGIYDVSEHTEGTGLRIKYFNPTKKTIKYITTTLVGYNAVGDPVKDNRKRKTQVTVKGIGPIEPGTSAGYEYDYVWFTDIVEKYKIVSIKVQYMDGTSTVVKDPKKAWLDKQIYEILTEFNEETSDTEEASATAAPAAK